MATSTLLPAVQGPPPNDPLPGTQVGQYRIDRAVAAGGMGIVYVARHAVLGRSVAVKVLRPEYARNAEQTERFLKEAQAISGIRHKGIVTVEDFGSLPDGRQYMVMEFLEGENLEQVLQRDAPLHANRALPIMDEVLDALSAAHKVGVVHRDLKPSNIFLTTQSNGTRYCKLVDFGLAQRSLFSAEDAPAFAKASLVAGTPEYVSPEQARGLVATARTDLYCCGVILYEMLTGRLPFAAPSLMELLRKQVYEKAPRVSHSIPVPESLDDLVASMLEKEPEARPRSADVVRQAIARILKEMKEASTQYVSRPAPLMRPPGAMAEPVLEETHVSGPQGVQHTSPAPRAEASAPPKEPRSDGRGKKVPAELLNGTPSPRERSDGRGKKVPAEILAPMPLPKDPKSDGRGKKAPEEVRSGPKKQPEILSLPPEPKSDGRGRKGINFDENIDSQVTKPPEAVTPKVDAQMERTLDGATSGSEPLITDPGVSPGNTQPGEETLSAGGGSRDLTVPRTSPKQWMAIVGLLLFAVVVVAVGLAWRDREPEQQPLPPPLPVQRPPKVEKTEKVEPLPESPIDVPAPLHEPVAAKEPEPVKPEPQAPMKGNRNKLSAEAQAQARAQEEAQARKDLAAAAEIVKRQSALKEGRENWQATKKGLEQKMAAYENDKDKSPGMPRNTELANVRKECHAGNWKKQALGWVDKAMNSRVDEAGDVTSLKTIETQTGEFKKRIDRAKTPEECERLFLDIAEWAINR